MDENTIEQGLVGVVDLPPDPKDVVSHDTSHADPISNQQQADFIAAHVNASYVKYFTDAYDAWLVKNEIAVGTGKPPLPKPVPAFMTHMIWTEGWGLRSTVGPDLVCGYPPDVPPRMTEADKLDAFIGSLRPDGKTRYNLSNITSQGTPHNAGGAEWILIAEGMFGATTYWRQLA